MSGRARTTGMSLIEVMIAITILAMISTLVYSGFTTTARHKARIEQELDRSHLVSAALERMVRELSMAYVSQQTNASNQNGVGTVLTTFLGKDQGTRDTSISRRSRTSASTGTRTSRTSARSATSSRRTPMTASASCSRAANKTASTTAPIAAGASRSYSTT